MDVPKCSATPGNPFSILNRGPINIYLNRRSTILQFSYSRSLDTQAIEANFEICGKNVSRVKYIYMKLMLISLEI